MKGIQQKIKDFVYIIGKLPAWRAASVHAKDNAGGYTRFRVPKHREMMFEMSGMSPKRPMQAVVEVDVTNPRRYLRQLKEATGERLSFTAWVIKCIAQAVSEYKLVQACRRGKEIFVFDDVDVAFVVAEGERSDRVLGTSVIRKANEQTVRQMTKQIRNAQAERGLEGTTDEEKARAARIAEGAHLMPKIIKRPLISSYERNPFLRKVTQGTMTISSLSGAVGAISGTSAFPIFRAPCTLFFGISIISIKPGVVQGRIEPREYLPMGIMFDHDVVDGEYAARFMYRLGELLQEGYGLEDIMSKRTSAPA